ncbi:hypothetical protein D3C80_550540 [compost metagenome]
MIKDLTYRRFAFFDQRQIVFIGFRTAFQRDIGPGNAHRFTRIDLGVQHRPRQPWPIVQRKFDGRLIIAKRSQPLTNSFIHACAETAISTDLFRSDGRQAYPDVFFQFPAKSFNLQPHIRRKRRRRREQRTQKAQGTVSWHAFSLIYFTFLL